MADTVFLLPVLLYDFFRDINHEAIPENIRTPTDFVTTTVFPLFTEEGKTKISDRSSRPEYLEKMRNCPRLTEFVSRICGKELQFWPREWNFPADENRVDHLQTNVSPYTLVLNLSEFPENQEPEGGATCVKVADGDVRELNYTGFGDAILCQGSTFKHCGNVGTNFTKEIYAFGLGLRGFLTQYPSWFFIGNLDQTWPKEKLYWAIRQQFNVRIRKFHIREIDREVGGRRIRNTGSCHVSVYSMADRNRLVGTEPNGSHRSYLEDGHTRNFVHIKAINSEFVNSQSLN